MNMDLKLSVLDQSPVIKGQTSSKTLQNTLDLACYAEGLGYHRFWLSEHYNTDGVIGSAPEIMIAHIANHTKKIKVGAGGIMLLNYSPLKVAEIFHVLESLHPGRIDLGMAKSSGANKKTANILNPHLQDPKKEFIDKLNAINKFLDSTPKLSTEIKAMPIVESSPERWLLVSSIESAIIAAEFGMGVSFAHFINPTKGKEALEIYRNNFKPSENLKNPKASFGIFVFCSLDKDKIHQQQAMIDHRFIQLQETGNILPINFEDIKDIDYSDKDKLSIKYNRQLYICGTPEKVKKQLDSLIEDYKVDEIMLATYAESIEDKKESYKLIADLYNS